MRRTVRCVACGLCAFVLPPGFTSSPELHCTRFDVDVEPDDGCTMGERGEPFQAREDYAVTLSAHPSDGWSAF